MEKICKYWINRQKEQCGKKAKKVLKINGMEPQNLCEEHYKIMIDHFGIKEDNKNA